LLKGNNAMNCKNSLCRWMVGLVALVALWATPAMSAEPVPASGQSATQLPDGRWLMLGGAGALLAAAQLIDASTGQTVTLPGSLATPRAFHSATVLADGRVLVLGGLGADGLIVRSAEVFDPASLRFATLPDTGLIPRARHTATVLMDGRVLVAGGISERGTVLAESELWDPASGRPDSTSIQLINPRMGHSATTLPSEPVLISGGRDDANAVVSATELYMPHEQRFTSVQGIDLTSIAALAPAVQATVPDAGAVGVTLDSRIAVRFSKPLSISSLTTQTVTLIGPSGAVAVQVVPAEGGMLLFVTPRMQLSPAAHYTLFIAGAADPQGIALPFIATSFTTQSLGAAPTSNQTPSAGGLNVVAPNTAAGVNIGAAATTSADPAQPAAPQPQTTPLQAGADAPTQANAPELWIPGAEQMHGDWRSKRPDSELQALPALVAAPGVTAVAGQVLLLNGNAAVNVTLTIGAQSVRSGTDGRFLLQGVAPGGQTLVIDGASANQPGKTYGYFEARITVEAGKTNALRYTIWLSQIDTHHGVSIPSPTAAEVVVTTPFIPGLELHIPKGTVLRDRAGRVVTQVSITPIPVDRTPFPLVTDYVPVYFTIQPGGVTLQGIDAASAQGARLFYPNYHGDKPGTVFNFWNYDPMEKGWYVYGQGKVSVDGQQVLPDAGVAIYEFTGAMISSPSIAPPNGPPPPTGLPAPRGLPTNGLPPNGLPPNGLPPNELPPDPPPNRCPAADPVDCSTGLFLHTRTDLALRDTLAIELTRTYRPLDTLSRPFGIGTNHIYGMFLVGDVFPYTYQELILPDGGRIRFNRTSPGTSYTDAVYGSVGAPGAYAGAVLKWCSPNCAIPASLWSITWKDGTQYFFPDSFGNTNPAVGHINGIIDRYGNQITLTHNAAGLLTQITSPNGRWIGLTYDASNRIISASDNLSRVVSYTYDASGRLATATNPEGGVESYTYDTSHRMLTVTKPGSQVMVTNVYDANGRVSQQTLADGGIYSFTYTLDGSGKVTQTNVTDPRGYVRRIEFSAAGYLMRETLALGQAEQSITTLERDTQTNRATARTDPLGRRTEYGYDTLGNLTSVTRMAGTAQAVTTTMTYEPSFNQLTSFTDGLGHVTQYRRDSSGSVTEIENPLGQVSRASYDAAGRVLTTTDPLNNVTGFSYDGGDLKTITDPLQRAVSQFTDAVGRVIGVTDALGNMSSIEYDRRDLPTRNIDAAGNVTTIAYDANGNLHTVVDAKSGTWTYGYDVKDRLASVTNPLSKAESYLYDGADNLTRLTQRNGTITTFTYDALGRKTKAEHGRTLQGGNLTAPDATVNYTYDAGSRLTQLADTQSGTIGRTFDNFDRLTQESTVKGTVTYSYDAAGRRQSMTAGAQGATSYSYDNSDRLLGIARGALQASFTYDAAGRPATLTLPNGIAGTYNFDVANQLTAISYALGTTTVGDLAYQYDAAGRRTQVTGSLASTGLPAAMASATYDAASQLGSWAGSAHSYDDNGNLTSDGQRTYTYDSRNRLAAIAGAASASFSYDALGRRTDRTVGSMSTGYLYDGANAVQELSGSSVKADLLTGLGVDQVLARTDSSGTMSLLTDALGSTLALADASAVVQSTYVYEPYGQTTSGGAASDNAVQYTGRENDGTGLYFYRARYYDPVKGRFIQSDPIGLASGANTYVYVSSAPTMTNDPTGLLGWPSAAFAAGFNVVGQLNELMSFGGADLLDAAKCVDFNKVLLSAGFGLIGPSLGGVFSGSNSLSAGVAGQMIGMMIKRSFPYKPTTFGSSGECDCIRENVRRNVPDELRRGWSENW
jgi:RHS repeat-associated protein